MLSSVVLSFAQDVVPQPRISLAKSDRVRVVYTPVGAQPAVPTVVSTPTEEKRDSPSGTVFGVESAETTAATKAKKETIAKPKRAVAKKEVAKKTAETPTAPDKKPPVSTSNPTSPAPRAVAPAEKKVAVVEKSEPKVKEPVTAVNTAPRPTAPAPRPPAEKSVAVVEKSETKVLTKPASKPEKPAPVAVAPAASKPAPAAVVPAPVVSKPARVEPVIADEAIVFRGELKDGLRRVLLKSNAKWGYVNKDYVPVIAFRFDRAFDFNGGEARVEFEGKPRRINKRGDFVK